MSADELTAASRAFYEEARWKMALSIIVAAGSMLLLGFCSIAGGEAASNKRLYDYYEKSNDSTSKDVAQALEGGYGFASFCFILGFVLLFAAAIYLSPTSCGSELEKKTLSAPIELPVKTAKGAAVPMMGKQPDEQI